MNSSMPGVLVGVCMCVLSVTPGPLRAQADNLAKMKASCGRYVLEFYDSYATNVFGKPRGWLEPILHEKRMAFSRDLLDVLEKFSRARINHQAEIDDLDFDPFLHAQDTADRYVIGSVTRKGDRYWVEVFGVSSGKKSSKPDVVPELTFKDGQCLFVNFHYGDEDLVSILKRIMKTSEQNGRGLGTGRQ
jgi:hypothetical protein